MKGFYAYPSQPPSISQSVVGALGRLSPATYDISTWAENDIAGKPLIDPILENIETSDLLIADITRLNFNCSGPGSLNRFSASLSGVSAGG
jgi:hypothetical protein